MVLLHYADLTDDLEGQMRTIAERLGLPIAEHRIPALVEAAGFGAMRERADELAPDEGIGLFRDREGFFGRGRTGQWRDVLDERDELDYQRRADELLAPDLRSWLHR
ncbi:MAG: sulfotransferase domain-containing protein [Micropruina sp.]|uniref:sulfotransferase domain-containing protein n=1 Tax=Micropruina sp. TaxID=2737536 RepID=UPI0039E23278